MTKLRPRTIGDPKTLRSLLARLRRLRVDSARRWGTLSPHEMLCHLGDATDMVLGSRPRVHPVRRRDRRLLKWLALWAPAPWPRGVRTNPLHDPRAAGTKPSDFGRDLTRVIAGLELLAAARPGTLEPAHGLFGTMSVADWQRWAYRHTNHHLRQFGQ